MDRRVLLVFVSLWSSVAPDGDDVRLVRGASRCAGILEKKHEEDWKPVDDQLSAWNLTSAAAVCRKLDCGSVVSLQRRVTLPDTPPDFLIHGFIHGLSRSTSLEISCSDSVQLVDGTSPCSGRLEVKSDQSDQRWSSVCEADFDQQDAEVVCRELGCGAFT
ncbi:Scavenger receptor cysteine-rich type 1 protein M130 Soluble CD163 [Larimichthys crocea]|uniref:Scavenger receptor cysteine-rich type 1 protein M130 Soluble CD163 n=1 Tax=Larimichthys crocea TaxID=215358 RepID=A0A6G0IU71_LARCR|nr:Scavenger receptor cysteine-rich type 1 protein M130 Soluble CD163 [Larimichthys crocea]